jgi:hypothetical protein
MFSYPAGILQTSGAKSAENHFNGVTGSSNGDCERRTTTHVATAASAVTRGKAEQQGPSRAAATSPRRQRKPREQPKHHQHGHQCIQAVQRMELKIRVPRKAVTSRQHSASSPPHPCGGGLCYLYSLTKRHCRHGIPVRAHTARRSPRPPRPFSASSAVKSFEGL